MPHRKRRVKKKLAVAAKRRRFTKKQLALIRRVLALKGLPPALRQMLLVLIGASMKPSRIPSKKTKSKKKRRATAKQLAVRRKFKAFITKHHRAPRKGEHL